MKITGFSFIRNAILYDYPIIEAINSILPLCDNFIICVGNSDDETLQLIKNINSPKINIIETFWDETLRKDGAVLASETNKAFQAITDETDWAFYIQGDEILHEKYLDNVFNEMAKYKDEKSVNGLLFNYLHFYGSYDYVGISPKWYRKEIRVIKNDKSIFSYGDAQGFRKYNDGKLNAAKLNVKPIDAYIYHYGWVKHPKNMKEKSLSFNRYWHDDNWIKENISADDFDYSNIDILDFFRGTHPKVMLDRINKINWKFAHDISINRLSFRYKLKLTIEKLTGYRIGEYKNYKII
jgi:hypothetical protein